MAIHTKTGILFGQHFDSEPPRNFNHVSLRQFEQRFNKKIGTFMFKNQNDGAIFSTIMTTRVPRPSASIAMQGQRIFF